MGESIKSYINKRGSVKWNTLYKKYGTKKVNKAINSGKIYSGMSGEARALG